MNIKKLSRLPLVIITILLLTGGFLLLREFMWGNEPQTAADCTSVEKYDVDTQSCYYECDTDEECAAIETQIDKELNEYFDTATTKAPKNQSSSDSEASSDDRNTFIFSGGRFSPTITDKNQSKYTKAFVSIAGANFANSYLNQISFFDDSSNDSSASVVQDEQNPTKWNLEINMAFADNEQEMLMTLVHEYAHVFSLNKEQVNGDVTGACPRLSISEGCTNQGSFINEFNSQFWTALKADPDSNDFGKYYSGREDDFVSEYAATNALEDFAETFAYATLKDTSDLKGIAAQKVAFMQQDPIIKKRTSEIKASLAVDLRARKVLN